MLKNIELIDRQLLANKQALGEVVIQNLRRKLTSFIPGLSYYLISSILTWSLSSCYFCSIIARLVRKAQFFPLFLLPNHSSKVGSIPFICKGNSSSLNYLLFKVQDYQMLRSSSLIKYQRHRSGADAKLAEKVSCCYLCGLNQKPIIHLESELLVR